MKHYLPIFNIKQRNIVFLCSILLVVCCHSQKKVVVSNPIHEKSNTLELIGVSEIKQGLTVNFELVNNSLTPITIFGPWFKNIEKYENGSWLKVKIILCPCGADCSAPPKTLVLNPTEKHKYDWNLMEGWCGKIQANGIPEIIENLSSEGLYRILIDYSIDGTNRLTISKEFKIIN